MKRFLLLMLLSFVSCVVNAQAKVYQIEMIIFSHTTSQSASEEQWPTLNPDNFDFTQARLITPLPSSQFVLKEEQLRLNQNPAYQTLLHTAWRQSIVGPGHARAVRIVGTHVRGVVRISVQRYLNVSLNLLFKNGSNYFHLLQNRRMRSNELNYIDFPFYGALIKIVPVS